MDCKGERLRSSRLATLLAYSGSGGGGEVESLEVGCAGAVDGFAGPPGVEPDEVDRCGGGADTGAASFLWQVAERSTFRLCH
jgi:hypothetical protein